MSPLGWALAGLALAGTGHQLLTAWLARLPAASLSGDMPAVSILKPLHGAEPRLGDNLATALAQDYRGAVQLVCGVADAADPALVPVASLREARSDADIAVVVDPARHGGNAKVSNLINFAAAARHAVLVLSDSDIAVPRDWLAQVTAALARPGVGAVTCAYAGRGDAGGWSRLAAATIDWGFLPATLFAARFDLARPCMGSTIALTRDTLTRLGGFAVVADALADDHALGGAVAGLGLAVVVAPPLVVHGCGESSLAELVAHELRWNVTIRHISPWGFVGLGLLNPLPPAVLALAVGSPAWPIAAALAARLAVALRIRALAGGSPAPLWWLPARDVLSFILFAATFFQASVDWRGRRLGVDAAGQVTEPNP